MINANAPTNYQAKKKILFVLSSSPYSDTKAMEAIDAVLTAAAFDMQVTVLVLGDGVWQLRQGQKATAVGQKPFTNVLAGLSEYDIEEFFVSEEDLLKHGLLSTQLLENCKPVAAKKIAELFKDAEIILHG